MSHPPDGLLPAGSYVCKRRHTNVSHTDCDCDTSRLLLTVECVSLADGVLHQCSADSHRAPQSHRG